jgi:hypothetical protein
MSREALYPFCLALVRKLKTDIDERGAMLRQSADLG